MSGQDEIKELHRRNVELQDSVKEVLSETRCRFCPVRFIRWLRGLLSL